MHQALSKLGHIVSMKAGRDKKQRPYCFVYFEVHVALISQSIGAAQAAVDLSGSITIKNRALRIELAKAKELHNSQVSNHGSVAYVESADSQLTDEAIKNIATKHGNVVEIIICHFVNSQQKYAFIYFSDTFAAHRMVSIENGAIWKSKKISCSILNVGGLPSFHGNIPFPLYFYSTFQC